MDQRRTLTREQENLFQRHDVDRLYVPRKEGGRGFVSIQDGIGSLIQRLEALKKTDKRQQKQYRLDKYQQNNNQEIKMGRKTNVCTVQVKFNMRIFGHGNERGTLKEKLNLS